MIKRKAKSPGTRNEKRAVLITASAKLAASIKEEIGMYDIAVKEELGDLRKDSGYSTFILDTKVHDMNTWPKPIIVDPSARSAHWKFIFSNPSDIARLNLLPDSFEFIDRKYAEEQLSNSVKKSLDPESNKKIESAQYIEEANTMVITMQNRRTYPLKLDDLDSKDKSEIVSVKVADEKDHIKVIQRSGNAFDIPWDDVLYHCEPTYPYFKGKTSTDDSRVANRVRKFRNEKGWSVAELARRADMKRPNLSRLEAGRHSPTLETMERLADALGIRVVDLLA